MKVKFVKSKRTVFIVIMVALVALAIFVFMQGDTNEDDNAVAADPVGLLTEAADKIRAADTFRMEVRHSGAEYWIPVYLGDDRNTPIRVAFRRALAQYVAEDTLQAEVSILMGGVAVGLDVFSKGLDQWWRLESYPDWVHGDFAPGFSPKTLIGEHTGFQAALAALKSLEYLGRMSLDDGTPVYHLSGTAHGPDITSLLVGLIEATGTVDVDVFINADDHYPARLIIRQTDTITDEQPEPTTWILDVYDIDADPDLTPPEGA